MILPTLLLLLAPVQVAEDGAAACARVAEYDEAIKIYSRCIESAPGEARAYIGRGECFREKGDLAAAMADFDKALALDPKSAYALTERAITWMADHKPGKALADCDAALRAKADLASAMLHRGRALRELKKTRDANDTFARVLTLPPGEHGVSHAQRGVVYIEMGEFASAAAELGRAIEKYPAWPHVYADRAAARIGAGDFAGALADCRKAIELAPKLARAHFELGRVKEYMGDFRGAIPHYSRVVELNPRSESACFGRAVCRNQLGDPAGAVEDYTRALELNTNWADAYHNRGLVRSNLKQYRWAVEDFDRTISIEPAYLQAYVNRGWARRLLGEEGAARKDFTHAATLEPRGAFETFYRGLAKEGLHDPAGAAEAYKAVLRAAPEGSTTRQLAVDRLKEIEK